MVCSKSGCGRSCGRAFGERASERASLAIRVRARARARANGPFRPLQQFNIKLPVTYRLYQSPMNLSPCRLVALMIYRTSHSTPRSLIPHIRPQPPQPPRSHHVLTGSGSGSISVSVRIAFQFHSPVDRSVRAECDVRFVCIFSVLALRLILHGREVVGGTQEAA